MTPIDSHQQRNSVTARVRPGVSPLFRFERGLLALVSIVALGLFLFLRIASEVRDGETMTMDRAMLLWLRVPGNPSEPIGPHWLVKAMTEITALGGGTVLTLITVIVAAYLVAARRPATAAFVVGAIAGGALLSAILKDVFERPRPELVAHLVNATSASFPSGHAMNSAVTYLTLGTLLAETEESQTLRVYLVGTAIFLSLIVGSSRV